LQSQITKVAKSLSLWLVAQILTHGWISLIQ
jgi:hypothetical protein